jgi:hypothetical protein
MGFVPVATLLGSSRSHRKRHTGGGGFWRHLERSTWSFQLRQAGAMVAPEGLEPTPRRSHRLRHLASRPSEGWGAPTVPVRVQRLVVVQATPPPRPLSCVRLSNSCAPARQGSPNGSRPWNPTCSPTPHSAGALVQELVEQPDRTPQPRTQATHQRLGIFPDKPRT